MWYYTPHMSYYHPKPTRFAEPDSTLDLHGCTAREAHVALEHMLEDFPPGSHIRIIVGKGRNSAGEPVLPGTVRAFLAEHDIEHHTAHPRDGGTGAVEVFL
jgi:DNA-nicking Smr family endonuclease